MRFIVCLWLLMLAGTFNVHSAARFEKITIEHGLSQNTVMCILQDSQGFLWLGTQDGLNRFDGHELKVYQHQPKQANTLSDDYILSMIEGRDGKIWIGTFNGGLNRFDPVTETFTAWQHEPNNPNSPSHNRISAVVEDHLGTIWMATWGGGVSRFWPERNAFIRYMPDPQQPNAIKHHLTWSIVKDKHQNIWVGTYGAGLARYEPQIDGFTHFQHAPNDPNSLSSDLIWALMSDNDGSVWVGTEGAGLNHFDGKTNKFTRYQHDPNDQDSLSNNIVRTLMQEADGSIWVGTYGGLNKLAKGTRKFTRYLHDRTNPASISGDVIYSSFQSRDGILWIGTYATGINKLNPKQQRFGHVKHDESTPGSLSSNAVWAITKDAKGTLWIGTDGGGLNQYLADKDVFIAHKHQPDDPNSLPGNRIWSIKEDSHGDLWVGTYGTGVARMSRETGKFKNYPPQPDIPGGLSNGRVMALYEDNQQNLWLGTYIGLNLYQRETDDFKRFVHEPHNPHSLSNNAILSIMEDTQGFIWLGTYGGGLNRLDRKTGRFTRFLHDPKDPSSIAANTVMSTYQDNEGNIWAATYGGGLSKLDVKTAKFHQLADNRGLASTSLYGILPDSQGNLWVSSNKGLSMLDMRTLQFINYGPDDGVQSNEFNAGAYYKSPDGELLFGGINGFNHFYGHNVKRQIQDMPLVLTEMQLFNEPIGINHQDHNNKPYLSKAINYTQALTLSHHDSLFSFEFAALDYTYPEQHHFAYKLLNYDDMWINTDHRMRRATYTNIPAGQYTLQVKARGPDSDWGTNMVTLNITITPAPWLTWWAYTGYVIVVLTLVGSFAWQRYQKYAEVRQANDALEQLNQELELRVQNRTEKLTRAFNKLQQTQEQLVESEKLASLGSLVVGVAHELNTPLGIATTAYSHIEHLVDLLCTAKNQNTLTRSKMDDFEVNSVEGLRILGNNLQRCDALVQQFKALAAEQNDAERQVFNLSPLLYSVAETMRQSLDKRAIALNIRCDEHTQMQSYPKALEKVLQQLLENSLIHAFEKDTNGHIAIVAQQLDKDIVLHYSDNGSGLDAQALHQIFDPFYTTKRGTECTGLGMLIVYNLIVHQLKGTVSCASEPKQGLAITITLPLSIH